MKRFLILSLAIVGSVPTAFADGLVSNGHVTEAHTNITLTQSQMQTLAHGRKKIVLTTEQKKTLSKLQNASSVKELTIYPATIDSCTCELVNVGVKTGLRTVEVPNFLFGRDREAEERGLEKLISEKEALREFEAGQQQGYYGNKIQRHPVTVDDLIKNPKLDGSSETNF